MIEITFIELLVLFAVQGAIIYLVLKAVLGSHFLKTSKNVKMLGPVLMLKSKKGLSILDKIANAAPRFWKTYADLGIVLGFGFIGSMFFLRKQPLYKRLFFSIIGPLIMFSTYLMEPQASPLVPPEVAPFFPLILFLFGFSGLFSLVLGLSTFMVIKNFVLQQPMIAGVGPAIPGVKIAGSPLVIPWYGWLAFPIILFIHETSHGILARIANVRVKDAGLLFFGFLPLGAFVEPDEKALLRRPARDRLRLFAAGSMTNYTFALLLSFTLPLALVPVLSVTGINFIDYLDSPVILGISNGSRVYQAMGEPGDGIKLLSVNGTETRTLRNLSVALREYGGANKTVLLGTDRGEFTVMYNEEGYLGITDIEQGYKPMPLPVSALWYFISFMQILIFFNLVLSLMNLLPLFILDGGLMFETMLEEKWGKKKAKLIFTIVSTILIIFMLVNMAPLFFATPGGILIA